MQTSSDIKKKEFVKEYIANGFNGTQAVMATQNTKNANVARVTASRLLANDNVQEQIDTILNKRGFTLQQNLDNITRIANSTDIRPSANDVLKANLEMIRVRGKDHGKITTQHNVSLKADLTKLPYQELIKRHKDNRTIIDGLAEEI